VRHPTIQRPDIQRSDIPQPAARRSVVPGSSIATACHARLVVWCLEPTGDDDRGQTTAEYVLLILGAATIAILVTSWASATDKVSRLFDRVLNSLTNKVG
jgi:hypothetical protein